MCKAPKYLHMFSLFLLSSCFYLLSRHITSHFTPDIYSDYESDRSMAPQVEQGTSHGDIVLYITCICARALCTWSTYGTKLDPATGRKHNSNIGLYEPGRRRPSHSHRPATIIATRHGPARPQPATGSPAGTGQSQPQPWASQRQPQTSQRQP